MDLDGVKRRIQEHFADGLVTIVGLGLSAAAGLPTLPQLAEALATAFDGKLSGDLQVHWDQVLEKLNGGANLEGALQDPKLPEALLRAIQDESAEAILKKEEVAISGFLKTGTAPPFGRLLKHIPFTNNRHTVITTNYDRLLEFAAEDAGFPIDAVFFGTFLGHHSPQQARDAVTTTVIRGRSGFVRQMRNHVRVLKPHGSLDWYLRNGTPVRLAQPAPLQRLVITPGTHKYKQGYQTPFDYHRNEANTAIETAARYLVVGYGFGDDHLETHLRPELASGKPCLILTLSLTEQARQIVQGSPGTIALEAAADSRDVSVVHIGRETTRLQNCRIWSLEGILKEVFYD